VDEVTQMVTRKLAKAGGAEQRIAVLRTRSRRAETDTSDDEAGESQLITGATSKYGGDSPAKTGDTLGHGVVPVGGDMVSDRQTETADKEIGDTLTEFGNIDVSDRQALTESVVGPQTEISREFKSAQDADKSLDVYGTRASLGSDDFRVIDGLLHRRAPPSSTAGNGDYVLVLPESYQKETIRVAHSSLLGGHLGTRKTSQRIANTFWFPHLQQKVAQYVRCCHNCQMTRGVKIKDRQPFQPMEVIDQHPFCDLTIDFLGSKMPMTARRNQYILTIICNSTGWLHAIPMTNCKTGNIADQLLQYFCQVGFPSIIRSDNQFSAEILTAVREKLGIQAKFSTAHHPTSHGRIERTNRTLLEMLKKFVHERPTNWDTMLPYLLFALREVPSVSSRFSPFELVMAVRLEGCFHLCVKTGQAATMDWSNWGYRLLNTWNSLVSEYQTR